jgi:uncharacterized protein (TIGR03437 family)
MSKGSLLVLTMIVLLLTQQTQGQNSAVVTGAGYDPPMLPQGAPGQLITFSISGVGRRLTQSVVADKLPLPTVLADISISFDDTYLIPLLSAEPLGDGFTLVTAQIPYEANLGLPFHGISVLEAGKVVSSTRFILRENNTHILRFCDILFQQRGGACDSWLVYHLNGSPVTADNPARSGENLVLYAVGLGNPSGTVKSGEPVNGIFTVPGLRMDFTFAPNTFPKNITKVDDRLLSRPVFAGLVPGLVGLYQVNFQVPAVPPSLPKCDEITKSNLTVTIGLLPTFRSGGSFDGVGICVAP